LEASVARPTSTHVRPDSRWTTTVRPARTGYPYPASVKGSLVSTEAGAESDSVALTTLSVRVAEVAAAAVPVASATACQYVLVPAAPARTDTEKVPVDVVVTDATVDHVEPRRCSRTVRPAATGETRPENVTDSAGAATERVAASDTVELTSACAG